MAINTEEHLKAFVDAFVQKNRQERWHFLFQKNNEKTLHNSHKLLKDLSAKHMNRDDALASLGNLDVQGVIFDIGRDKPRIDNLMSVWEEQAYFDAIFSIKAGELAVFFFHEGETYILRK